MTISSTTRKAGPFFGNDATIDFPFTFKVFKKQDVRVTLTDPTGADQVLLLDSSYSVTLNTDQDSNPGGTVRYPVLGLPLPTTWRLTVTGGLPNTQPTDIQNNGGFYPQIVEDMGDRSTIQIQQLQEQIDRSLKFSVSDSGAGAVLPPADLRANKMLGFDAAGIPTTLIPATGSAAEVALALASFINSLANSSDTVQGSALVGGVSRIVSTIAELRNQRGDKNPYVTAIGYYTRGDKGPAFYFYDPTDGVSADNGGTVIVTQFGHRYKLNHPGSVNIDDFGAKGNGTADDSPRIQVAFDWASTTGIPLVASAKTYGLKLSQRIAIEGNPNAYTALVVKTRLRLTGAGMGKTIFKLLDNESTTADPKWFNVMTGNTVIEYLQLSNYTVDVNGQNNKIDSPSAPLPGFQCAGLMITGSVASVGVDARLNNSVIDQVEVKNNPGVTNIGIGNRYGHPGITGFNVTISRCRFYNSGIDSQDHSSVFAYGDNTLVIGCTFDHPTPSTGVRGPIVAVELHGSNNKMIGCTVRNYLQMTWIGAGDEGPRHGFVVADNTAEVGWWGIGTWSDTVLHDGISDIAITGNNIHVTGATVSHPHLTGAKHGLYLAVGYGATAFRLNISGNNFYCTDRTNNIGAYIASDSGSFVQSALLAGNIFSGFSRGVLLGAASGALGTISVTGNIIENCAATTTTAVSLTRGIEFRDSSALSLHLAGNYISSGDVGAAPAIGIDLAATAGAGRLYMDDNDTGDCAVGIQDLMTVSGRRGGRQATTFNALPAQSTWKAGDIAYLAVPTEAGVAGSKVMTNGWRRVTNGTGNVANTDWLEMRTLTGN